MEKDYILLNPRTGTYYVRCGNPEGVIVTKDSSPNSINKARKLSYSNAEDTKNLLQGRFNYYMQIINWHDLVNDLKIS